MGTCYFILFLYFRHYLFHHLHVWILLFSGGSMKVNLQMLFFWPNKSLGFLVFKLKQKRVFNLVGVLITLKCCRLQVENLDRIIILVKNWPDDSRMNCKANASFKDYIKFEVALVEENYEFIEESKYFEALLVDSD